MIRRQCLLVRDVQMSGQRNRSSCRSMEPHRCPGGCAQLTASRKETLIDDRRSDRGNEYHRRPSQDLGDSMAAYIVFIRDRLRDEREFEEYSKAAGPTLRGRTVKVHAAYGANEALEGAASDGVVLVEFP